MDNDKLDDFNREYDSIQYKADRLRRIQIFDDPWVVRKLIETAETLQWGNG